MLPPQTVRSPHGYVGLVQSFWGKRTCTSGQSVRQQGIHILGRVEIPGTSVAFPVVPAVVLVLRLQLIWRWQQSGLILEDRCVFRLRSTVFLVFVQQLDELAFVA